MLETLTVNLGERSYPVYIGTKLLGREDLLASHLAGSDVLVVTNEVVAPLYLDPLRSALGGRRIEAVVLPDGETHKTLATFSVVTDALAEGGFHRDATIMALGGGVVGDIAGFAAACYQRGVALIQVPTTLLAQVDAAVGGKTAVNHPLGKNLIGAFHQPRCVLADIDCLETLSDREYRAGLAEVVKYGLIRDSEFFVWLEQKMDALLQHDNAALGHAIRRSCELKAEIVAEDEREQGATRALLNLGHTFAHAIETVTDYERFLHGEAVAVGLILAAELSQLRGTLSHIDVERARNLIETSGLASKADGLNPAELLDIMRMDKKVTAGRLRLVLLNAIGAAEVVDDCPEALVVEVLDKHLSG